jgi:signal transduction histidine kinase
MRKAFTPLFTTKEMGSGLGLFMVKTIIENHGGSVSVEAAHGGGVVFSIGLPLFDSAAAGAADIDEVSAGARR